MTDTSKKQLFRAAFPECTAVADAFRAEFGDGVKLTYTEENGKRAGRALDESKYRVISGADLVVKKTEQEKNRK